MDRAEIACLILGVLVGGVVAGIVMDIRRYLKILAAERARTERSMARIVELQAARPASRRPQRVR